MTTVDQGMLTSQDNAVTPGYGSVRQLVQASTYGTVPAMKGGRINASVGPMAESSPLNHICTPMETGDDNLRAGLYQSMSSIGKTCQDIQPGPYRSSPFTATTGVVPTPERFANGDFILFGGATPGDIRLPYAPVQGVAQGNTGYTSVVGPYVGNASTPIVGGVVGNVQSDLDDYTHYLPGYEGLHGPVNQRVPAPAKNWGAEPSVRVAGVPAGVNSYNSANTSAIRGRPAMSRFDSVRY